MAGRGVPPKDPTTRARRNKPAELRVIETARTIQPDLPTIEIEADGQLVEFVWPARTVEWWQKWRDEWPLSAEFTALDWEYLLDTALLHARVWRGELRFASELRLRVAAFGTTPADRARLRLTFAMASEIESRSTGAKPRSAKQRYRNLKLG